MCQSTVYSLQSTVMSQRQHRHPCDDFTIKVLRCHKKYGKQGEECVREELAQKKCFAQMLCRREAARFYDERAVPLSNSSWQKVSCSTVVEVFAKPENELEIPEGITKEDRKYCKSITHALATCLAKKRKRQNR